MHEWKETNVKFQKIISNDKMNKKSRQLQIIL